MHAIYFLLNLCFNRNIKFKFKLYSNYIKIVLLFNNLIFNNYNNYYLIFIY